METNVSNSGIKESLNRYVKYVKKEGFDKHFVQQLAIRVDRLDTTRRLFISGVTSMSFFRNDLPHYWTKYKGRFLFIYVGRTGCVFDSVAFGKFHDKFRDNLNLDISRGGVDTQEGTWWIDDIEGWMVNFDGEKIVSMIPARFPTSSFYNDFDHDKLGNTIYRDGVLSGTSLGRNGPKMPPGIYPTQFILSTTNVPLDSLSRPPSVPGGRFRDVDAIIEIDASGKITKATIIGIIDVRTKERVEQALLDMPSWKPAKVNGKPVYVRLVIGI